MLTSANVAGGGLSPSDLTTMGSTVFFAADDGVHGSQLWSTNGTSAGTAMVADINGTGGSDPAELTATNGVLYFSAYTTTTGFQLWQTNGTSAGTTMDTSSGGSAGMSPTNLSYWTAFGPVFHRNRRRCGNGQLEPSLHRWILRDGTKAADEWACACCRLRLAVGCHLAGRSSSPEVL